MFEKKAQQWEVNKLWDHYRELQEKLSKLCPHKKVKKVRYGHECVICGESFFSNYVPEGSKLVKEVCEWKEVK